MSKAKKTIEIDGVEYVRADSVKDYEPAEQVDGLNFVIVRDPNAGVYFGWLKEENGVECVLVNARNVHYWSGAASLMQMANEGVKNPDDCRFTQIVKSIKLKGVCEILPCTKKAQDNLTSVEIWKM